MTTTKRIIAAAFALVAALVFCACSGSNAIDAEGRNIAGRQAGNEAVYYSFAYPADWELAQNDGVIMIRRDCNESDLIAQYASISVMVFGLSDVKTGARDYWKGYREQLEKTLSEFKMLNSHEADPETSAEAYDGDETKLGDTVALKVRYAAKVTETTYYFDQIICCRRGEVYIVTLTASNEDYDGVKDVIDSIAESFVFE